MYDKDLVKEELMRNITVFLFNNRHGNINFTGIMEIIK
jgi:hypothetical protein